MKLNRVIIKNFRSIKYLEIKLDPTCLVLVGINESGKSNILKALALLDDGKTPRKEDIRETSSDVNDIKDEESYVRFIFNLEDEDIDNILNNIESNILSKDNERPIVKINQNKLNLRELCAIGYEGIYHVDLHGLSKNENYRAINNSYNILDDWGKPSVRNPSTIQFGSEDGEMRALNDYPLIYKSDSELVSKEYLEKVSPKDLNELLSPAIMSTVKQNIPKCIFWAYDEKHLLPGSVNFDAFATDPNICPTLKNIFLASKIRDIPKAFADARSIGDNRVINLLNKVAINTTRHFHKVWKGYEKISFDLRRDGDKILIVIRGDENSYNISQRSDGFKRFICFLLNISVKVESDLLNNTLLLIDEPDLGLHPSGAKYLRDELIKISEKNHVVYSTHSPFMIDNKNIGRHILVKKENEETSIDIASDSNFVDEEVIYNVLGCSVFDALKEKNIIFEGWRDKKLFRTAINKLSDKQLKSEFEDTGICHANGVKHIIFMIPLLELAQRKYFIVSDSDIPAKQKQKEYKKERSEGAWKRYDEILQGATAVTGEDFIKQEKIEKVLERVISTHPKLLIEDIQFNDTRGVLFAITEWLNKNGLSKDSKDIIEQIKNDIFDNDNLKPSDIKDEYYNFIAGLAKIINKL